MSRPQPYVLFAQTFVHPYLDEHVDEILFSEPVVITACEFLEQNASSTSSSVKLIGATSPPSFALEVFVHSEEEPRFRRLCQPFLYSPSSSNVLEVEAVITSHLVVRGSYRSLTLVIYGNTAEDLGQVNIGFDLDASLVNLVASPSDGKLEDLPPALHSTDLVFEEAISALKILSFPVFEQDLSQEMKQFLKSILNICQLLNARPSVYRIVNTVVSAVCVYITSELSGTAIGADSQKPAGLGSCEQDSKQFLVEAQKELLVIYKMPQSSSQDRPDELLGEDFILEPNTELSTPELLVDIVNQFFPFGAASLGFPLLSESENMILGLSMIFLLCSGRESCFHFVNSGGMGRLAHIFSKKSSPAVTLMLLGVVERATRHAIGCEGFLGWWPREDENVPTGTSEGYNNLVKLLLKKQRHDVASLATYILHRLRCYEIASLYESKVLSALGNLSDAGRLTRIGLNSLVVASSQLKKLLKLVNLCGPVEDPSPIAHASKSYIFGQSEVLLSYKTTVNLISASKCAFSRGDIDIPLLSLLKERGFLPLSAALLSSSELRSQSGFSMDIFVDIVASVEAILLSLLACRSGLIFFLHQPEIAKTVILALKGDGDLERADCIPLRYAFISISKHFLCRTQEVGMIVELHLRVVNAIDHLLTAAPHSEEFLWVLWELCALSRSDAGRQALLVLGHFQEAIVVLIEALHSAKELQPATLNSGASPLNLAICHSAAEIFEIIVTDSTSTSLASWIGHAMELHKALHSSSPGTNRKDAPTRLLEWIDAGVVYHRNGPIGLLRYAAVLASGGDAHLSSANILVSDSIDVENFVGDSSNNSDVQVMENLLGKLVADKYFEGVALRDSSIAQLTTAFRILAFISENSAVAAALYQESAVTLIYVVLVNCKYMLERSSNTYDYLVDEGVESNSTSNLLLERSCEQSLIDLMIPCLTLLVTVLQRLQEAKEQHRNTKLLNALLKLHREVSPKLAACATDLSSPYPGTALGLGAVCRLLMSALACWPVFGWTPGLFHCLLESVQTTSQLTLGPKEASSLFWLLGDLFPEEGIWLWKNGMPSLSAVRTLGVGTLLGPQKENDIDWYLRPGSISILLSRLTPLLDKIAQVILHFAFTALVVVQDMLRVFVIRIACQKAECALVLLQPIFSWLQDHVSSHSLSDTDIFKVQRLLNFIASLLEHPCGKALVLSEGAFRILIYALENCCNTLASDGKLVLENGVAERNGISLLAWCSPLCKSLILMSDAQATPQVSGAHDKSANVFGREDYSIILHYLLKICQVIPVGKELYICLTALKELSSSSLGRKAFASLLPVQSSLQEVPEMERGKERKGNHGFGGEYDWKKQPPLLFCLRNILRSANKEGFSVFLVGSVSELCLCALLLSKDGKNFEGVSVIKYLFGLPYGSSDSDDALADDLCDLRELLSLLDRRISEDEHSMLSNKEISLFSVKKSVESLLVLLQSPMASFKVEPVALVDSLSSSVEVLFPRKIFSPRLLIPSLSTVDPLDDDAGFLLHKVRKVDDTSEKAGNYLTCDGLVDKFLWECPDTSDRLAMQSLPVKRKIASIEGTSRRSRGDMGSENVGLTAFSRGLGGVVSTASSGSTRRDTFRQRKPNTSRPPSMHVDDYVARERNADGLSGSNLGTSNQRGGSTGGRPPSIHVDEFMARQRERQNSVATHVAEATPPRIKTSSTEDGNAVDKVDASRQLKAEFEDDLQEINIVFDEEPESDEKLPFSQPDDNIGPPVIVGENSPHSVVEETDTDLNESSQFSHLGGPPSSTNRHSRDDFPSGRSISQSEMPLSRQPSINSEQNRPLERPAFSDQVDDTKQSFNLATNVSAPPAQFYSKGSLSSPGQGDARLLPPTHYQRDIPQAGATSFATASHGAFQDKYTSFQPPLPPMPPSMPAPIVEAHQNLSSSFGQPPLPSSYASQTFDAGGPISSQAFSAPPFTDSLSHPLPLQFNMEYFSTSNSMTGPPLATPHSMMEPKYSWAPLSSGNRFHEDALNMNTSLRPLQPPLPPTPPPYTAQTSTTQSSPYNQTVMQLPLPLASQNEVHIGTSYAVPSFIPQSMLGRPVSAPGAPLHQQSNQNTQNLSSLPLASQSSIAAVQPPLPLQLPQPPRLPHPLQQPRPTEQGITLQQSPIHVQLQTLQAPQQVQVSQAHLFYPNQNNQNEHSLPTQSDSGSQQLQDSAMTLQRYFSSPEAIQSLLSDREKLCQLLEQHPKLMQMLQEKLGQM